PIAASWPEASLSARAISRSRLIPGKTRTADFMALPGFQAVERTEAWLPNSVALTTYSFLPPGATVRRRTLNRRGMGVLTPQEPPTRPISMALLPQRRAGQNPRSPGHTRNRCY